MARNIRLCEGDIYCSLYNPRTRTAALAPSSTSIVEVMPAAGEENFAPQGLVRGRGPLGKYEGGSALRPSPKLKTQFFGQPQNSKLSPLRGPETQNSKLEPGAYVSTAISDSRLLRTARCTLYVRIAVGRIAPRNSEEDS